jgi:hypothetical protein
MIYLISFIALVELIAIIILARKCYQFGIMILGIENRIERCIDSLNDCNRKIKSNPHYMLFEDPRINAALDVVVIARTSIDNVAKLLQSSFEEFKKEAENE